MPSKALSAGERGACSLKPSRAQRTMAWSIPCKPCRPDGQPAPSLPRGATQNTSGRHTQCALVPSPSRIGMPAPPFLAAKLCCTPMPCTLPQTSRMAGYSSGRRRNEARKHFAAERTAQALRFALSASATTTANERRWVDKSSRCGARTRLQTTCARGNNKRRRSWSRRGYNRSLTA